MTNYEQLIKPTSTGRNAHRASWQVYVGEKGKALDPTDLTRWHRLGRPTAVPDFNKASNPLQIKAGLPTGLILNIPTDEAPEMSFSFDIFGLQAMQMAMATDVAIIKNDSLTGQTTVASGGTKTSATLTSASDFEPGDLAIVDLSHATYGGFPEMTIITKVTGNVVEFEPLPLAPANSATFKKVAGLTTGTDKDDTGLVLADTLTQNYPRYQLLVVANMPSSDGTFRHHIPEFEITGGNKPNFNDPLATLTFTGTPILQDPETFTLLDGTTSDRAYYMKSYWIPKESA